jgi:hypothetical protein
VETSTLGQVIGSQTSFYFYPTSGAFPGPFTRYPSSLLCSCKTFFFFFQTLPFSLHSGSIPFWLPLAYPKRFAGLILDKSIVEVKGEEPFYGASGVCEVLAAYPPSVFRRFLEEFGTEKKGKKTGLTDNGPVVLSHAVKRY